MISLQQSEQVAKLLSAVWSESHLPSFFSYVLTFYGVEIDFLPNFRCVYIGEAEEGDINNFPHIGQITQWWQVDHQGFQKIAMPKLDWDYKSPYAPFFYTPVIVFYYEFDKITIIERLGQKLICWKAGPLIYDAGQLRIGNVNSFNILGNL